MRDDVSTDGLFSTKSTESLTAEYHSNSADVLFANRQQQRNAEFTNPLWLSTDCDIVKMESRV